MNTKQLYLILLICFSIGHPISYAGSLSIISTYEDGGQTKPGESDSGFLTGTWVISPIANNGEIVFLSKAENFDGVDFDTGSDVFIYSSAAGVQTLSLSTSINVRQPRALSVAFGGVNYTELRQDTDISEQQQNLFWRNINEPVGNLASITNGSTLFRHLKMSDNGQFLVYEANDVGLTAADTDVNGKLDIFIREIGSTGDPTRISQRTHSPDPSLLENRLWPDVSDSGLRVVFESADNGFVVNDTNEVTDIYLWVDGNIQRINQRADASETQSACIQPAISGNGSTIIFVSEDSGIVGDDTNGKKDIFSYKTSTGDIKRINLLESTFQGDDDSDEPDVDNSGRYVVFRSKSSNFPGASNNKFQIYLIDVDTGTLECASVGADGLGADTNCSSPAISPNGRYVTFSSAASNLSNIANGDYQVYRFDRDGNSRPVALDINLNCDTTVNSCNFQLQGQDVETPENNLMYQLLSLPDGSDGIITDKDDIPLETSNDSISPSILPLKFKPPSGTTSNNFITFSYQVFDGQVWSLPADVFITLADFSTGYLSLESAVDGTFGSGAIPGNASSPASLAVSETLGFSGDGRWILFASNSSNLTPESEAGLFLRDSLTGKTILVNNFGNSDAFIHLPVISLNGQAVAYVDLLANPIAIFWSEIDEIGNVSHPKKLEIISPSKLSISADGTQVAFDTFSSLAAADVEPETQSVEFYRDIYLWRPLTGEITLISQGAGGEQTKRACINPSISPDGTRVAFITDGIFSGDESAVSTTTATWVKYLDSGNVAQHIDSSGNMLNPTLSWTGRYVSYGLGSSIEVADLTQTSANRIIKTISNASFPNLSADGRYLYFVSSATGFSFENSSFTSPNNAQDHAYRLDLSAVIPDSTNLVSPLSVDGLNIYGNGDSFTGQLSENGQFAVFVNDSTNLLSDDNGVADVFRADLGPVINVLPIANDLPDEATLEDTNHTINLIASDAEGNDLRYEIVSAPEKGVLGKIQMPEFGEGNPKIMYAPAADVFGTDFFTYKVRDAEGYSSIAKVSLAIAEDSDPPILTIDRLLVLKGNSTSELTRDLFIVHDVDYPGGIQDSDFSLIVEQSPQKGTLSFSSGGDASSVPLTGLSIIYTLNSGIDETVSATDTIIFRVVDANDPSGMKSDSVTMDIFIGIVVQDIQLYRGWNLVSIKHDPLDQSPVNLFRCPDETDCIKGAPWSWDATNSQFVREDTVVSERNGYWLYVDQDVLLANLPGDSAANSMVNIESGWNLIGPSGDGMSGILPDVGNGVGRSIWNWDAQRQIFVTANELEAGRGYWVYVNVGISQIDFGLD